MVTVKVGKVYVAGTEVVLVNTIVAQDIQTGSLCLLSRREYPQCLIAVESIGRLAYLGADGGAIDLAVHILGIVCQFGNLVFVVTQATAHLQLPVFEIKHLEGDIDIETGILQFAAVRPVLVKSGEETQRLLCQQVVCPALECVERQGHPVIQQTGFQSGIDTACGLPLYLGVSDAAERQLCNGMQVLLCAEVAAGSIVIDIIVAADIVAGSKTQVVKAFDLGQPRLIAHDP